MATAAEKVRNPHIDIGVAVYASNKDPETAHYRVPLDTIKTLPLVILKYGAKGQNKRVQSRAHVLDAVFEDSIDKTPTFTLTIHDPDWDLLSTGALDHKVDLNPGNTPNRHYRLDAIEVNDDDITLTFATRNAIYMSYYHRPKKANRKNATRAQFILSLVRAVKHHRIAFYCPQLKVKQPIGKTEFPTDTARRQHRQGQGFSSSDNITVKGQDATGPQRRVVEKVIQCGYDMKMPGLVIVSGVMCVIQESTANEHPPANGQFVGAFQQSKAYGWPATTDAYKDAKGYYNRAILVWRNHNSNMDLGSLVATVQGVVGSTNPLNFGYAQSTNKWRGEAQHAVNAFGGIDVADPGQTDTTQYYKKKYEFHVGEPDGPKRENYLAATYRLAEEVNWSAFWVGDTLHYQSEEDLFKQKPAKHLRRYRDGVENVSFGWDKGKKMNDMTLQVRMERWVAPLGTVVQFDEGGPARGRWLITNIRRSMFDELGEITLSKPMREKREPANEAGSRQVRQGGGRPGSFSDPTGMGLMTIEDVNPQWTPYAVVTKVVLPYAKYFHMARGYDAAQVKVANHNHGHTVSGSVSDHEGPPDQRWAVDMSNGTGPTKEMDDLASALLQAFNFPRGLANPNSTGGYVAGNLVEVDHKGYHFQLIYRTTLGGNHYNHVHFGCHRVNPPPPIWIGHHKGVTGSPGS